MNNNFSLFLIRLFLFFFDNPSPESETTEFYYKEKCGQDMFQ